MAWIKVIDESDANSDLETAYAPHRHPRHGVDNIMKIHSLDPPSLQHHYQLYRHIMTHRGGLSRAEREMIAVVVSKLNDCHY